MSKLVDRVRFTHGKFSTPLLWFMFVLMSCACLYPLFWLILNSLKTSNEMFDNTWRLPSAWIWQNYANAWEFGIQNYLINSLIITVISVVGILFFFRLGVLRIGRFAISR